MTRQTPSGMPWHLLGQPSWPVGKIDLYTRLGRKQRALLGFLLLTDQPTTRSFLTSLLWPNAKKSRGLHSLRQALVSLKKALGAPLSDSLIVEDENLSFDKSELSLDVTRFSQIESGAPAAPEEILEICRGPLLDGMTTGSTEFDTMLVTWRVEMTNRMVLVMERAIAETNQQGRASVQKELEQRLALLSGEPTDQGPLPATQASPSGSEGKRRRGIKRMIWNFGGGLAVGVALFAGAFALSPDLRSFLRDVLEKDQIATASIAVKPFTSVNGLPAEQNLAGGVTVGVTYALYAITARELFVVTVPPDSMGTGNLDARSYARSIGVRYLITGQLEQDGGIVRVFARCLDTETGVDVWQDRFDSNIAEAFQLQDEITLKILRGLDINLSSAERNRLQYLDDTENLKAWLLAADGVRNLIKIDPEHLDDALESYRQALQIDPEYTSARRGLAWHALLKVRFGVSQDPQRSIQEARNHLNVILRKRPDDGMSKALEGLMLLLENQWEPAVEAGLAATQLLPGSADVWAVLAHSYTFTGQPELALDAIERAMALSPGHPQFYDWIKGRALRLMGDHNAAIALLRFDLDVSDRTLVQLVELAAAYSTAGQIDEAQMVAQRIRKLRPGFSASAWVQHPAAQDPDLQSLEFELLSKAGL